MYTGVCFRSWEVKDLERELYRENLRVITEKFPGVGMIRVKDAAKFLSVDYRTLLADPTFPAKKLEGTGSRMTHMVSVTGLAKWMSA